METQAEWQVGTSNGPVSGEQLQLFKYSGDIACGSSDKWFWSLSIFWSVKWE